ncbi:NACHT, LRR and PYD domains-containing protein 1 homolog [Rhinoraja longicauda]
MECTLETMLLLLIPRLAEGYFPQSYGMLNRDILLPCTFHAAANFNLNKLIITWQRTDSLAVVYSFYSGSDHPEHHDAAFLGRAQLFHSEFCKGNASLKLKRMLSSDVGNYTCFVTVDDGMPHIENMVELKLNEILGNNAFGDTISERRRLLLIPAALLALIGYAVANFLWLTKNKKKTVSEEKIHLLEDDMKDAIQNYREYILKGQMHLCCSLTQWQFTKELLDRTINVTNPKEEDPDGDLIRSNDSNVAQEVYISQLLSLLQKEKLSKRFLLVGDAGVGKSWTVVSLEQEWASQSTHALRCVFVLRFRDLNEVKGKTSLRDLLKKHCTALSSVLTQLFLTPQDVLIILDGLDECTHQLQWNPSGCDFNLDSEAEVGVLVSKLISKKLLREAQVLVTSRWNSKQIEFNKKYFDRLFVISGFTNNQLRRYCEMFCVEKQKAEEIFQRITENATIKCLASNPLNSFNLCNILDNCTSSKQVAANEPVTNSKVFTLLLYSLFNCSKETDKSEAEDKLFKDTILKLGELSFNSLLSGKLEINAADLKAYKIDPCVLLKYLSNRVLEMKCKDQGVFEFHHAVLKEQFAALYCATLLNDEAEELVKCLDLWCFGKRPLNQMSQFYLLSFQPDHRENLYNLPRFLTGFLTAGRDGKLWNYTTPLPPSTSRALTTWFKNSLQRDIKKAELLNLMHCLFELNDATVTAEVSPCIRHVDFHNVSLSSLDLRALCYCLNHSTVEEMDLSRCGIGDKGIKQLREILVKCRTLMVSANKLTAKSANYLSAVLEDPKCRIETLSNGTNSLGSAGAQILWKALAKNRSLKILRLYDNGITDEGTENMTQYLTNNKTLQKLFLCVNKLDDPGQRNIQEVEKLCHGLKIISKIRDDEELLLRVESQVEMLPVHEQSYGTEWLCKLLKSILKDLGDESTIPDPVTRIRIGTIKANINKYLQKTKVAKIDVPDKENGLQLHKPAPLPLEQLP